MGVFENAQAFSGPHLVLRMDLPMKKLLTALKWNVSLSVTALVLTLVGCKGGFDVDLLPLDKSLVVNYGEDVTSGRAAVENVVYGQLMPGSGQERTAQVFTSETKDLSRCVMRMRGMLNDYDFDTTQETNFKAWADKLQNMLAGVSPDVQNSRKSTAAARVLAGKMEAIVKTGGTLEVEMTDGKTFVPDSAKGEFDKIAKDCTESYDRVYQTSLVLAQTIAQKDALEKLGTVESALRTLTENLESRKVFTTAADLQAGYAAVKSASSKAQSVHTFIDGMARKGRVGPGLSSAIGDLRVSLTGVTNDYVAKAAVALKPEATQLNGDAISAANALDTIATQYRAGVEDLKDTKADVKLDALTSAAFTSGISIVLGNNSLDHETEVNSLSRRLGSAGTVVMKQDGSSLPLVESLASGVVYGVAGNYGLGDVDNVWGLRADLLIKAKTDFGMNQADYSTYTKSRAKKIRESLAKNGNGKNVYVVFADSLITEGADVGGIIDEFAVDNGKVLVITTEPERYLAKGEYLATGELDMSAAILAGNAILQKANLPVPAQEVSEKVVRLAAGLRGSLRIGDLAPMMRDAGLQVASLKNPSSADVDSRILNALASHNVPIHFADSSGVLRDSLSTVRSNLSRNRNFYLLASSGRGIAQIESDIKREEELKKLQGNQEELNRTKAARTERNGILAKANDTILLLKGSANKIDAAGYARNALLIIQQSRDEIHEHLDLIKAIATDRACSGVQMKVRINLSPVPNPILPGNLAADNHTYFQTASAFPYPAAGQPKDQFERVGPYAISMLEAVKNRLEISRVLANTNNSNTNELPYASLNCFAYKNVPTKVNNTAAAIKADLVGFVGAVHRVLSAVTGGADDNQVAQSTDWLRLAQGGLAESIKNRIQDFTTWDAYDNANFWDNTLNNFGHQARNVGGAHLQVNRRIYAYLFAMVVGKIQHASVPFNANNELYHGFVDNDVFLKKLTDNLQVMNLSERLVRTLILQESAELVSLYRDVISKIYDLPNDDREAFIKNATANDFLAFFNKLKTIVDDRSYLADFSDLTKIQKDLRDQVTAKLLPDEVMTMMDIYPASHPYPYFTAASGRVFSHRWDLEANGTALPGGGLAAEVQADYVGLGVSYAVPGATLEGRISGEYGYSDLRDLAVANGAPAPLAALLGPQLVAARAAIGPLGYPPAALPALKATRFTTASIGGGVGHLALQSDGVKKLAPIWDDLVRMAQRINQSAEKIYFYLTLIKKR